MEYILAIPFAYLVLNVTYYLTFSIASLWPLRATVFTSKSNKNKIAVLIPAYKEDGVIIDSAIQAAAHNYPKDRFDVFVIADQLEATTLVKLERIAVKVIVVMFEKSSKAKALNVALNQLDSYQLAVVLDADNLMEPNFLNEINKEYNKGSMAIQGQRIAKNEQNSLASLDAISEGINNNIFRKGHQNLGLSSALIGSGMAFDFDLFRNYMTNINALGGFDKELELSLLKDNVKIKYLPKAKVLDEKVSDTHSFSNQRTRWIAAQIRFGISSFSDGVTQLFKKGNIDYFDKVLQFVFLPRLILLGTLTLLSLISIFLGQIVFFVVFSVLILNALSLILATPRKYLSMRTFRLIGSLPIMFFNMIIAIGGYKKAKNNFLHTSHSNKIAS
ncbi:MAG: cellulose synthase/poly-beta-1,6-N-acetylglucosamine synthase-like glycosyltransferase [Cyclobacteriaceae bacterium]|jgi:cellulose synthase/poly-beta-1,6-N-acetylglucosamine synthase-like glycosyltransferase